MSSDRILIERFHHALVESIRDHAPSYLTDTFTVAEIYQSLVPYRTYRDRLGLEMNGDYEDALLRLLAGEEEFLILESEPARNRIRRELEHRNPNTGIYREFAAVEVRLNPERVPAEASDDRGSPGPPPDPPGRADSGVQTSFSEFDTSLDGPSEGRMSTSERSVGPTPGGSPRAPDDARLSPCPECAEELPARESLQFCPHCGANVLEGPCRECGEILDRTWKYCLACGTPTGV
ncbi:MAG: zinc ribbon domain-containing protein [Gemmatimonadota bacterium]